MKLLQERPLVFLAWRKIKVSTACKLNNACFTTTVFGHISEWYAGSHWALLPLLAEASLLTTVAIGSVEHYRFLASPVSSACSFTGIAPELKNGKTSCKKCFLSVDSSAQQKSRRRPPR